MYCKNCGHKLENDAKFCNECGKKVDGVGVVKPTEEVTNKNIPVSKNCATASMIIGIISLFVGFFVLPLPIIGLILGICQKGKCGEKTAGIIINSISLALIILTWLLLIIFMVLGSSTTDYQSKIDKNGNSDIIVNDNTDYNYSFDFDSIFE